MVRLKSRSFNIFSEAHEKRTTRPLAIVACFPFGDGAHRRHQWLYTSHLCLPTFNRDFPYFNAMTQRTVLDVGNCGPDHSAIKRMLASNFDVTVLQCHAADDTLHTLHNRSVDLVLINRKLDQDYSDGVEILKLIKADATLKSVPVMLVTNMEEYQASAVKLGAVPGFGKLSLDSPTTQQRLAEILAS